MVDALREEGDPDLEVKAKVELTDATSDDKTVTRV